MKSILSRLLPLLWLAILSPGLAFAGEAPPTHADGAIRQEFEALFANSPIYQAIRKNLPDTYETFYRSYAEAKRAGNDGLQVAGFVNSVRNTYLKQASDASILAFFRYTVGVGNDIMSKDPEAAFAYIFGGDPGTYAKYIDFAVEQSKLGELYDQILSSRTAANLAALDRAKAEEGLDYVNVLLFCKYGESFQLLQKDVGVLSGDERQRLCAIYLDMFNEIFQLAPDTRNSVLRGFASRMS